MHESTYLSGLHSEFNENSIEIENINNYNISVLLTRDTAIFNLRENYLIYVMIVCINILIKLFLTIKPDRLKKKKSFLSYYTAKLIFLNLNTQRFNGTSHGKLKLPSPANNGFPDHLFAFHSRYARVNKINN